MSVRVSAAVWRSETMPHGGTTLLVLLRMADSASDDGSGIWLSAARIARDTRSSARSVKYALRTLESDGWIVATGKRKGGRGHVTEYRIDLDRLNKGADFAPIEQGNGADSAPISNEKGANNAPIQEPNSADSAPIDRERVQKTTVKGADSAPEPYITVKDESSRERGDSFDSRERERSSPPMDDGSSGRMPKRSSPPAAGGQAGITMEINGWSPDAAAEAAMFRAGVTIRPEPEDIARFTTHYSGQWLTYPDVIRRWVKWMINEQQRRNRGKGDGKSTRARSFADAIGDPF